MERTKQDIRNELEKQAKKLEYIADVEKSGLSEILHTVAMDIRILKYTKHLQIEENEE